MGEMPQVAGIWTQTAAFLSRADQILNLNPELSNNYIFPE